MAEQRHWSSRMHLSLENRHFALITLLFIVLVREQCRSWRRGLGHVSISG
jgi:hypothetical protein